MFCSHCGQELKEGGKFCPRCGAPVDPAAGAGFSTGYQKMNPGPQGAVMKKGVSPAVAAVIIGVILVCIAGAVFMAYFLFFRNTYKTPIKNLVKVMEDQDTDAALALIPERYLKVMEGVTGMDSDELADMLEDELISGFDEYTGDIKVDYDIGDARDLTDSEIQSLESDYMGYLGDIEDAKEVEFSYECMWTENSGIQEKMSSSQSLSLMENGILIREICKNVLSEMWNRKCRGSEIL